MANQNPVVTFTMENGDVMKAELYPDTTYAYESGGDPEFITDQPYESYLEFYHTYYHPSNS